MMSGICKMRIYSQTRFLCFYSSTLLLSPHNNLVVLHIMRGVSFLIQLQYTVGLNNDLGLKNEQAKLTINSKNI